MKLRRWFGILLCALLCIGLLPTMAFAEESADAWDGTADTSWYSEEATEFHLTTAEQLAGLAALVNSNHLFEGKTVYLENDLDLSGHEWVSIGRGANSKAYTFCGTFDGQSHCIYNLTSHEDTTSGNLDTNCYRSGLFGSLYEATVRNLGISNADISVGASDTSTYGKGIITDSMYRSTVQNCWTTGSIAGGAASDQWIGGVVGFIYGGETNYVSGCYSSAIITGNYTNYSGIYDDPLFVFDSLGGIVGGVWTNRVIINDCWFDGSIVVNSIQAAAGGIVGYAEGTTINNCLVATTDIGVDSYNDTCWLGYVADNIDAQNCYWPADDRYIACLSNESNATSAGNAVQDYKDASVLQGLQANAASGIEWVNGIEHPTFRWDSRNIPADYSAVEQALAAIPDDLSLYTDESVANLENSKNSVDWTLSALNQDEVDAMAQAIEDAIAALEYRAADYTAVDAAIAKAEALNPENYTDFSAVETAVSAVTRGLDITHQAEVDAMAQAIEDAIAALEYRAADYTAVDAAIAKAEALNPGDYTDFSAVEAAVSAVTCGLDITHQAEVDAMAQAIEDAIASLEKAPGTPTEPDTPSGGNGSSSGTATGDGSANGGQSSGSTSPKTGDYTAPVLAVSLLAAAAAGLAGALVYGRKRKRNG